MADTGYIALLLAFLASLYSIFANIIGFKKNSSPILQSARNAVLVVCGLVSLAVGVLLTAIFTHEFQIKYVYEYTRTDMPLPYLAGAIWAGNDGSLLFWSWLLTIFAVIVVLQKRKRGQELVPYASAVILFTVTFILILLLSVANPFQALQFAPSDGYGMNPLLENPGMLAHPPTLLGGYALFTVPFAFAIAALFTGRLGEEWIVAVRRWALAGWISLSAGNLLGAMWAYVVLGWGGYWGWDPVENASFMPWLTGTAFLHSIMMQRRRGILKVWNIALIIITFGLTIFGTFLTRSGILSSVHSFADSGMGIFFLVFIGIAVIGSLALLYYRSEALKAEDEIESIVSRESTFLINNLLLLGAAFAILIGVVFPLISDAVRGTRVTIGPPFYNQMAVPILLAVVLLSGICTLIGWRRASAPNLRRNILPPLGISAVVTLTLFIVGVRHTYALLTFLIAAFVIATVLYDWFRGTRSRHRNRGGNWLRVFWGLLMANRPRYGGFITHVGIALMAIGITGSTLFETEKTVTMSINESVEVRDYVLTYESKSSSQTGNRRDDIAELNVTRNGKQIGKLQPEKRYYINQDQFVTEVAIHSTPLEDLYIIILAWDDIEENASFNILINPLVMWVWVGGWLAIAGGVMAWWPETERVTPDHRNSQVSGGGQ